MMGDTWGEWTDAMSKAIQPHLEGRAVWDLGAGSLTRSRHLVALGARHVVAVDKEPLPLPRDGEPITTIQSYFTSLQMPAEGIEVALLAWPVTPPLPGLVEILERIPTVIYLGSNVNGTACGSRHLWGHFTRREVLGHIPTPRNSLIVYGRHLERVETRPLVGEEIAATSEAMFQFQEAEDLAVTRGA